MTAIVSPGHPAATLRPSAVWGHQQCALLDPVCLQSQSLSRPQTCQALTLLEGGLIRRGHKCLACYKHRWTFLLLPLELTAQGAGGMHVGQRSPLTGSLGTPLPAPSLSSEILPRRCQTVFIKSSLAFFPSLNSSEVSCERRTKRDRQTDKERGRERRREGGRSGRGR